MSKTETTTRATTTVSQKALAAQAVENLAIIGGKLTSEDDIVFEGTKIVVPERMSLEQAHKFLGQRVQDEEQVYNVTRIFKYRPWDGAYATMLALKESFGFAVGKTIRTMFGDRPPQFVDVDVDVNEQVQVPWGAMEVPQIDGATLHLGATRDEDLGTVFGVTVECKRKHRHAIEGLFRVIESILKERSIYRGKAINGADKPGFIDTSHVDFEDVVYTTSTMQQLDTNIWARIRYADKFRELGQPTKRAVLLEGPYGTGKSLAAVLTAKVCRDNGWTFLLCRPGIDDWTNTLNTGRIYGPCVVFMEDIDVLASPGSGADVSKILDQFDGVTSKGANIIVVLTTNHAEKIHKGMLRPGRLDAIVNIGAMERDGVERLARRVIGKSLALDTDFDKVFDAMEGFMPAYVREAFDRAVGYSVSLNGGEVGPIGTDELVLAAQGLRPQLELMTGAKEHAPREGVDGALTSLLDQQVREIVHEVISATEVYDEDDDYRGRLRV